MESRLAGDKAGNYIHVLYWTTVIFCFAVLAWLNGRGIDSRAGFVSVYTICLLAFALLALAGLGSLIYAFNPVIRERYGFSIILNALARAFMTMLPFMFLALVAELFLDWNAAQVFTQAGIMTCGALVGTEVVRFSGGKMIHIIVPMAGAFLISLLWMLLSAAAQAAVR